MPSVYQKFQIDKLKYPGVSGYPTYHTGFETFHLVDKIIDPGFVASRASTQISLHIILQLSESPVIPYSLQDMTRVLEKELKKDIFKVLRDIGLGDSLDVMVEAFQKFKSSVSHWERETEKLKSDGFRDKLRSVFLILDLWGQRRLHFCPHRAESGRLYRTVLCSYIGSNLGH